MNPNLSFTADDAVGTAINGTLNISYRNGRYGSFPVGTLRCALGTFTVRDSKDDAWLETFEAGDYDGTFAVSELSLYYYLAYGSELRVCMRAHVAAYRLAGYSEHATTADFTPEPLPDPLEEEGVVEADFNRDAEPYAADLDDLGQLLRSFAGAGCEDWQIGQPYRIDTSIGRPNISRCRKALTALGYRYNMAEQCYYPASPAQDEQFNPLPHGVYAHG
mgnify:CR=1 FL=1